MENIRRYGGIVLFYVCFTIISIYSIMGISNNRNNDKVYNEDNSKRVVVNY